MAKIQDMLKKPFVHLTAILFITFLVYSNTFHAPFQFDDLSTIINNNSIGDAHNFLSLKGNRDIGYLTFSLNYKFGGLDVFGYHAVNLLIHMFNAVLVYFLVTLIFQQSAISSQRSAISSHNPSPITHYPLPITHYPLPITHHPLPLIIPLFSALLFAVHPLQTGAVTYISQRFTSLATLFYLLAFVAYIKFRLRGYGSGVMGKTGHGLEVMGYGLWVKQVIKQVMGQGSLPITYNLLPITCSLLPILNYLCHPCHEDKRDSLYPAACHNPLRIHVL